SGFPLRGRTVRLPVRPLLLHARPVVPEPADAVTRRPPVRPVPAGRPPRRTSLLGAPPTPAYRVRPVMAVVSGRRERRPRQCCQAEQERTQDRERQEPARHGGFLPWERDGFRLPL